MTDRIPVAGPWVTDLEVQYVAEAAASDWYERGGASVGHFELAFADHVGVRYAVAVPHCTAALHLALASLGIGPGDEVIVPDITWVATAAPIVYVGAQPMFADVDPRTWCLTADSVQACISPRTKAIITVDLYGGMPNMDEIREVADVHSVPIVEDAAEAIGADWKGAQAGSLGTIGTFSFHGSKTMTTGGEGGMLVTDDTAVYERVSVLRDHGRPTGRLRDFVATEIGFKYKMSSLQAAFGLAQLERLPTLIERKRQIFGWYADRLRDVSGVELNVEEPGSSSVYWMVTAVVDRDRQLSTAELMDALDSADIDSRPFFHPLSSLPAFAGRGDQSTASHRNVNAYDISRRAVNLPSALALTEGDVDRVAAELRRIVG